MSARKEVKSERAKKPLCPKCYWEMELVDGKWKCVTKFTICADERKKK